MNNQLHVHGRQSGFDSAVEYEDLIKRAKEIGASAIALTDHRTLTGVHPFKRACLAAGIKPIIGVEADVQEDDDFYGKRHLVIMSKDNIGYTAGISKAVTKSNKRIDSKGAPRMNDEILYSSFGKTSLAHDHVCVTTACVQGMCNAIILTNKKVNKEIDKIHEKKEKQLYPGHSDYSDAQERFVEIENAIAEKRIKREEATKVSKKSFIKKEKTVAAAKGTTEYEKLKAELEAEKAAAVEAGVLKQTLDAEITKLSKEKSALNAEIKDMEASMDRWIELDEKEQMLSERLMTEEEIIEKVKAEFAKLVDIFGEGNVFAEMQYHGIPDEAEAMPLLAKIAHECNIPLVAANDVHLVYGTEEERRKRQILRSLRYNKWEPEFTGDDQLYMKTDEELYKALIQILPEEDVKEAISNIDKVVDMCNYKDEKEDHFPKYKSLRPGETSEGAIRRLCMENIEWRFPGKKGWTKEYEQRLEYELDIICKMGYADYHLIVQDFLSFGRKLGKLTDEELEFVTKNIQAMTLDELVDYVNNHQTEVGLTIGPGRGSAVGSLVCYLLGITSIDPIKYGLIFERFLNPERVSMPDIDSDFASEIRDLVLEYVKKLYGEDAVCCIMTRGTQAARGSIRNCARLLGSEIYDDKSKFLALGDMIAKSIPMTVGISFDSVVLLTDNSNGKKYTSLDDYNDYARKNGGEVAEKISDLPTHVKVTRLYEQLKEEFSGNANAIKIIEDARLVEGTFTHYGMHAAGVIISDNGDVSDYISLMWDDKKKVWKSQCDMVEAEESGLLKMDFLGLKNLSIITKALRLIRKRTGKVIDIEKIEIDPVIFKMIFSTGRTNNVFQFESGGMKQMVKKFVPNKIEDIILLNAAYRPGPMQYINGMVEAKHSRVPNNYLIPELEPILENTYCAIIYQEQVMEIFQKLAGYTLGGADLVRRFMSKKKYKMLVKEREAFIYGDEERNIPGCVNKGIDAEKANVLFDQMLDFAAYAFNKSHAAAYAIVAYYTAWLKYYYPHEYLCAVLNCVDDDKVPNIMEDCKAFGVNVLPPDINESMTEFVIINDDIVFGLGGVKNVGNSAKQIIKERMDGGKYTSLKDFIRRGHVKKDSTESLIKAGALDCFNKNRAALLKVLPSYVEYVEKISDKTALIAEKQELIKACEDAFTNGELTEKEYNKKVKSYEKSITTARATLESAQEALELCKVPMIYEDKEEKLNNEKEMLGMYVSSHPLDEYISKENTKNVTFISDLEPTTSKVMVLGFVDKLNIRQRKKDGANMAFFKLEDKTGEIECACFTKAFDQFGELLHENAVLKISGSIVEETAFGDEESTVLKMYVDKIFEVKPYRKAILLHVKDIEEYSNVYDSIRGMYGTNDGHALKVHIDNETRIANTDLEVVETILYNKLGLKATYMK